MIEAIRAFDADDYMGESPIWSVRDQALWWVNCENPPAIRSWSPTTGEERQWTMPRRVGGIAFKASGGLLVVLSDGVYDFDPHTEELQLRAKSSLPDDVMLHECQCDHQGRLWVGGYDHAYATDRDTDRAAYFRLDGSELTPMIEGIAVANGLAFSPDGKTMYAADSGRRTTYAFDLAPGNGALSNRRDFLSVDPSEGFIDGATIDAEGGYWLALVASGEVRRYHPDGSLDLTISVPFSNPTKPAFGGPDLATMYLTSTKLMIRSDSPKHQGNGGVWAISPGFAGVVEIDHVD